MTIGSHPSTVSHSMLASLTQQIPRRLSALALAAVVLLASALAAPGASAAAPGGPGIAAPVLAQDAPGGAASPDDHATVADAVLGPRSEPEPTGGAGEPFASSPASVESPTSGPSTAEAPAGQATEQSMSSVADPVPVQPTAAPDPAGSPADPAGLPVEQSSLQGVSERQPSDTERQPSDTPAEAIDPASTMPAGRASPVLSQNVNLSIRILSPGDDGGVGQSIVVPFLSQDVVDAASGGVGWTWEWNWTWDWACGPGGAPAATAADAGAGGWNWNWNWNWSCGSGPAPIDRSEPPADHGSEPVGPVAVPPQRTEHAPPSRDLPARVAPVGRRADDDHLTSGPRRATAGAGPHLPLAASAPAAVRLGSFTRMPSPVEDSPAAPRTARASAGATPGPDPARGPPDRDMPPLLVGATSAAASGGGGAGSVLLAALLSGSLLLVPRRRGRTRRRVNRLHLPSRPSRLERPG
jgi:hypothetical protein